MSNDKLIWTDIFDGDRKGRNIVESHSHDHYELSLVICGDVTVLFDNKKYVFEGNSVIVSPPSTNHHILVKAGRYYRRNLYFYPEVLKEFAGYGSKQSNVLESDGLVISLSDEAVSKLEKVIEFIDDESIEENTYAFLWIFINTIVNEAGEYCGSLKQNESYIDDVIRTILNEYPKKLVAEELAARFFVSRTKLMTDFKRKTGKTLLEYITFVRLEHAKEFLRSGKDVMETALICGFQNSANFARVFKKQINISPKKYQIEHR